MLLREAGSSLQRAAFPNLLGPNANKDGVRQVVRWEGEGGHFADTPESTHGVHEQGHAATIKDRFGVDVDKYLDHGSVRHRRHHQLHQHVATRP